LVGALIAPAGAPFVRRLEGQADKRHVAGVRPLEATGRRTPTKPDEREIITVDKDRTAAIVDKHATGPEPVRARVAVCRHCSTPIVRDNDGPLGAHQPAVRLPGPVGYHHAHHGRGPVIGHVRTVR
jgi:hypothetical protein